MIAIVDAGPLYAVADLSDADHQRSLDVLQRTDLWLVIPALVVALAERLKAEVGVTLDHRHFAHIRPKHQPSF